VRHNLRDNRNVSNQNNDISLSVNGIRMEKVHFSAKKYYDEFGDPP
jgi:hypothetical protein